MWPIAQQKGRETSLDPISSINHDGSSDDDDFFFGSRVEDDSTLDGGR